MFPNIQIVFFLGPGCKAVVELELRPSRVSKKGAIEDEVLLELECAAHGYSFLHKTMKGGSCKPHCDPESYHDHDIQGTRGQPVGKVD